MIPNLKHPAVGAPAFLTNGAVDIFLPGHSVDSTKVPRVPSVFETPELRAASELELASHISPSGRG